GTFMKTRPEECYDLIENMTAHHNDWDTSAQRKRETEATKDTVQPTNNGSTKGVQPPVVQSESLVLNYKPVNSSIIEPVASPVSASRPKQKPSIPYPSRLHDQKLRDKANEP
nr:reverse transcriptase domain-containing protein [Tanacetum cinerariifolium]